MRIRVFPNYLRIRPTANIWIQMQIRINQNTLEPQLYKTARFLSFQLPWIHEYRPEKNVWGSPRLVKGHVGQEAEAKCLLPATAQTRLTAAAVSNLS